jgi:hypothetical protein
MPLKTIIIYVGKNYALIFANSFRPGKHWVAITDWGNLVPKGTGNSDAVYGSIQCRPF